MPRNNVSEWDTVASNNTDIGGINIAEGWAAANVNNAIRELMAQVSGYPFLITGSFGVGSTAGNSGLVQYSDAGAVTQFIGDGVTSTPSDKPRAGRAHAGAHIAQTATRWVELLAEVAGGSSEEILSIRWNYDGDVSDWRQVIHTGSPHSSLPTPEAEQKNAYAWANNESGATIPAGGLVAGSNLRVARITTSTSTVFLGSGTFEGTWAAATLTADDNVNLFFRVA